MSENTNTERAGRFTKKPVTIDAWLIDFGNKPLPEWVNEAFRTEVIDWCPAGEGLYINTLEGHMLGANGSWLIKGVQGELYACKPEIFEATYTRASLSLPAAGQEPVAWQYRSVRDKGLWFDCTEERAKRRSENPELWDARYLYDGPQPATADAEDAQRYRWLREQHEGDDAEETCCVFAPNDMRECLVPVGSLPGELDEFIDAAIAAHQGDTK